MRGRRFAAEVLSLVRRGTAEFIIIIIIIITYYPNIVSIDDVLTFCGRIVSSASARL